MVEMAQNLEGYICYDEFWLSKDMENMGYFFEYCEDYCREILEDNDFCLDKEKFLTEFMKSDCRALMEIGHPTLISQAAYDTVKDFIQVDNDGDIAVYRLQGKTQEYRQKQLYWIGWIYAYIHFTSKERSRIIVEKLPLKEMLIDYKIGHEVSKKTITAKSHIYLKNRAFFQAGYSGHKISTEHNRMSKGRKEPIYYYCSSTYAYFYHISVKFLSSFA